MLISSNVEKIKAAAKHFKVLLHPLALKGLNVIPHLCIIWLVGIFEGVTLTLLQRGIHFFFFVLEAVLDRVQNGSRDPQL